MSRRKKNGAKNFATDNVLRLVGGETVIKASSAESPGVQSRQNGDDPRTSVQDTPLSDAQMLYGKAAANHRAQTYIQPTLPTTQSDTPGFPVQDGGQTQAQRNPEFKPEPEPKPKPKPNRHKRVITDKNGQLSRKPENFIQQVAVNPLLTDVIPAKKAHPKPRNEQTATTATGAQPDIIPVKQKHAQGQQDAEPDSSKQQAAEPRTVYLSAMLIMEQMGVIARRYKNCECDICNRRLFFEGLGLMPTEFVNAAEEDGERQMNEKLAALRPLAIKVLTKLCISARVKPYHDRA
jgi:hypothetical protein